MPVLFTRLTADARAGTGDCGPAPGFAARHRIRRWGPRFSRGHGWRPGLRSGGAFTAWQGVARGVAA